MTNRISKYDMDSPELAGPYEAERRVFHAVRPGFRITELQIGPTQHVPWHYHSKVQDTFYVLTGSIRILVGDPEEDVQLMPGQVFSIPPGRPHRVMNAGNISAIFFVLQGIGEYDFLSSRESRG